MSSLNRAEQNILQTIRHCVLAPKCVNGLIDGLTAPVLKKVIMSLERENDSIRDIITLSDNAPKDVIYMEKAILKNERLLDIAYNHFGRALLRGE